MIYNLLFKSLQMAFTRTDIIYLLRRLSSLAQKEGITFEIAFYGGSCLLLAYDYLDRALTKDIDAIIRPREVADKFVQQLAIEENLPDNWLDQGVTQFVSPKGETYVTNIPELKDLKNLKISFPTASYLIAMKIRSSVRSRFGYDGDLIDLKFLARKTNLRSIEEAQKHLDKFFEDEVIPERAIVALEEVFNEKNQQT